MTTNADRWLRGRHVGQVAVVDPSVLRPGGIDAARVRGASITGVERRAKHMIIRTSEADLAVHFRMTGKVVRGPRRERVRWFIETDDGTRVDFVDARRLGELRVLAPGGAAAWLATLPLGPDAWPGRRDGAWWADRFAGARGAIKPALLDQRRVAGIGNILASEILWSLGVSPFAAVDSLGLDVWARAADAVPSLIDAIIAAESGEEIRYVGERGGPDDLGPFAVYGRHGRPCPRCGSELERARQQGRSTFWCPACQPGEPPRRR